jgi:N-acetylglucosaminyldiphosphoundecaprenol N-acetyl-beta-D-mannosaminyltransferase
MSNDSHNVIQTERVLGLCFFTGTVAQAVAHHTRNGGYLVIPAAPALLKLNDDEQYRLAMQGADLTLADSGLLVLLWRLAGGRRFEKISGISYFRHLFEHGGIQAGQPTLWLFGSTTAKERAGRWLGARGVGLHDKNSMVAAMPSSSAQDYTILVKIEEEKPKHVIVALPGGGQEQLAHYLRDYLLYRPSIHCVGAALDFLSGEERAIPEWAERSHVGWLMRLCAQPRMILPRIGIAFALARMIFRYRAGLPPLKKRWADV